MKKQTVKILIWGNDYNSRFVFKNLLKLYSYIDMIDISDIFIFKLKAILNCNVIYVISGKMGFFLILAKFIKKRIIFHWVGTDVIKFNKLSKFRKFIYLLIINKHIFVSKNLQNELELKTNKAVIFPIIDLNTKLDIKNSIDKKILTYIPQGREDFFYGSTIVSTIIDLKTFKLNVIGNNGEYLKKSNNIKYWGWIDDKKVSDLINACSIYIRFTKHDGIPKLVINNLYAGNAVIYNHKFLYTYYCDISKKKLINSIKEIYQIHILQINKQVLFIKNMYIDKYTYKKLLGVLFEK